MRALLALLVPLAAAADPPKTFAEFEDAYQFECNAPFEHFEPADVVERDGYRYEHTGATVKVRRAKARKGPARLGLLSGIKDLDPETQQLLTRFFADFEKADVELVVVGGDSAEEPAEIEKVLTFVAAATRRPIVTIAGNSERAAALNYAVMKVRKAGGTNLINMDLVRRYDGDGFDVVSVAGYHDKRYLHATGACIYTEKHVEGAEAAAKAADDPVVLLAHGPPRQKGQQSIDFVPGADNVGDPRLTQLITSAKIPFGAFGHILEAGARATDLAGKPLPPLKPFPALYVDQGSANPLPWKLNDGTTSFGLAAILTIDGKRGSWEALRAPKPAPRPASE